MRWNYNWAYDGVNSTVPRNAGAECRWFLSLTRIIIECICVSSASLYAFRWSWANIKRKNSLNYRIVPKNTTHRLPVGHVPWGKQLLLITMSFTLGLEMGFKFASRSVIYILNPCHITSMMQIYLLAANPSDVVTILFRIQMNYLNGPFLAFVFPETDSRQFTLEAFTYWAQHALMCIIPVYLMQLGGVYTMEPVMDFDWSILAYASLMLYHFIVLQILSLPTHVNLNHMLCPAVLDPFEGPNYRIAAVIHQGILCPLLCKLVCLAFTPRGTVITGDNNGESVTESVLDSHNNKTNKVAQLIDLNKQRSQLLACDNSQLSDGTNVSCTEKSVVDGVQLSTEPDELLKTAPSSPLSSSGLSMTVANHHNNESGLNKKID